MWSCHVNNVNSAVLLKSSSCRVKRDGHIKSPIGNQSPQGSGNVGRTLVLQPPWQYLSVQPVQVTFHNQQQGEAGP